MVIKSIMLADYRNYEKLYIELGENVNIFIGDNAQGKTNILEAVYYCTFAKSHRTSKSRELIKWGKQNAYISVLASGTRRDKKIDIKIMSDGKKIIKINSVNILKAGELFGNFNVVLFSPEDLKIIKESPGTRRKMLDMEISQTDSKYYYSLVKYNKILSERNTVLKNKNFSSDMIEIYDMQLAEYADYIIKKRLEYIDKVNYYGSKIHKDITSGSEEIRFEYNSSIDFKNYKENYLKKLKADLSKDLFKGSTSAGPHKDDFKVFINNVDAKTYGSQGQQRTAVLTMKFSSLEIIKEITGEFPVLLLDDVLSELDVKRKKYILGRVNGVQTIITCTGIEILEEYLDENAKIFKISKGECQSK